MMILQTTPRRSDARHAFTLIELLLVMTLLAVIMSVTMPTLSGFFRGRTLDSEARRLLSLTRHGQSRAVSEGIPMLLWVDEEEKRYGLETEPGWDDRDPRAIELNLDKNLKIEVEASDVRSLLLQQPPRQQLSEAQRNNLPHVRFLTDGTIDESSPVEFRLIDPQGATVTIAQATNRLGYEIRKDIEK